MKFLCQCEGVDDDDDWFVIETHNAEWAAEEYIERCESMSGGEMLNDPWKDKEIVRVKDETGVVTTFRIAVEFTKLFFATQIKVEGQQ